MLSVAYSTQRILQFGVKEKKEIQNKTEKKTGLHVIIIIINCEPSERIKKKTKLREIFKLRSYVLPSKFPSSDHINSCKRECLNDFFFEINIKFSNIIPKNIFSFN